MTIDGFRPVRKGESGYAQRRYVNESTGETISRRKYEQSKLGYTFEERARRNRANVVAPVTTDEPAKPAKARKPRADKGMTRADYKLVKGFKGGQKEQIKEEKENKRVPKRGTAPVGDREVYRDRLERAIAVWNGKLGTEGIPSQDSGFWDVYHAIRHPEQYDDGDSIEAYEFLMYDGDEGEDTLYDFPFGETP